MVRASGREANIDAVLAKFSAFEATGRSALGSFDALVEEYDFATKSSASITGRTLVQVARGEAAMLLTLTPDDANLAQTVLVVGVRQGADRELELLIANSYPPFVIKGTTDVVSPNLIWARALDVVEQCVSENQSTETVRVYELNRDLGIEITPAIDALVIENEESALIAKLKHIAKLYGVTRSRPFGERVPSIQAYHQDVGVEGKKSTSQLDLVCALANLGRAAGTNLSMAEMRAAKHMFSPAETSRPSSEFSDAVDRLGIGRRIPLEDIGVVTMRSIEVGTVALAVTVRTKPLNKSSRLDTAVVLGARSNFVARPEFFIVVSDPDTNIYGVVQQISPFQMWVDADSLLDQCVSDVSGRDGVQAYELFEQNYVIRGS